MNSHLPFGAVELPDNQNIHGVALRFIGGQAKQIAIQASPHGATDIINALATSHPPVTLAEWGKDDMLDYTIRPGCPPGDAMDAIVKTLNSKALISKDEREKLLRTLRAPTDSSAQKAPVAATPARGNEVHALTLDYKIGGVHQKLAAVGTDDFAIALYPGNIAFQISKSREGAKSLATGIMARLYQLQKAELDKPGFFERSDSSDAFHQGQFTLETTTAEQAIDAIFRATKGKGIVSDKAAAKIRSELLLPERVAVLKDNPHLGGIAIRGTPQSREIVITPTPESAREVVNALVRVPEITLAHTGDGASRTGGKTVVLSYKIAENALPGEALAAVAATLSRQGLIAAAEERKLSALAAPAGMHR